jgi:F-box/leucine-rich repeat protein 2/20
LLTLEVAGCSNLTDSSLYTFASSCIKIQRMDLEECVNITDNTLLQLSIHCPDIKELTLSHCENLTDSGIEYISKSDLTESLEGIDLDNCPLLTDQTILLLSKCKKLKSIGLVDCSQISKDSIDRITRKLPKLKVQAFFAPEPGPTVAVQNMRTLLRCPIRFNCNIL